MPGTFRKVLNWMRRRERRERLFVPHNEPINVKKQEPASKPIEQTRKYKRRTKIKPRFTLNSNIVTLPGTRTQYRITRQGWRRITNAAITKP